MFGSGFLKVLVVCFLLLRLNFEPPNHNRQRAAIVPMMVGTVVRMVSMMSSTEAHDFPVQLIYKWSYTSVCTSLSTVDETGS